MLGLEVAAVGFAAGVITTVTGFGGGLLLVVVMSFLWGPVAALVVSSLALLVGNLHRLLLFRRSISLEVGAPLVAGIVPGALAGALVAVHVPAWVLHAAIAAATGLALVRVLLGARATLPRTAVAPAGLGIGALSAITGGAGAILGALLQAVGLRGERYIATIALAAVATHVARLVGYGVGGAIDASMLRAAGILALAIIAGNLTGRAARGRLGDARLHALEVAAPVVCGSLALLRLWW